MTGAQHCQSAHFWSGTFWGHGRQLASKGSVRELKSELVRSRVAALHGLVGYDNYIHLRCAARGDGNWLVGAPTCRCRFLNPKR